MSNRGHQTLATYTKTVCQAGPYRPTDATNPVSFADREGFVSYRDQSGLSFNNFAGLLTGVNPFPVCTFEGIITQKNEGGLDNSLKQLSDPKRKTGLAREGTLLMENVTSFKIKGGQDVWIIPPHYFLNRATYDALLNTHYAGKNYAPALPISADASASVFVAQRLGLMEDAHPAYNSIRGLGTAVDVYAGQKSLIMLELLSNIPKFRCVYTTPPRALLSLQSL